MLTPTIHTILTQGTIGEQVRITGWVRTKRISKRVIFITLQDGGSLLSLQLVVNPAQLSKELLQQLTVGASLEVVGTITSSPGREQAKEIAVEQLKLLGTSPTTYPLQPKTHGMAFLRGLPHLRIRTATFKAVFRIRHAISHAIHTFLHQKGFCWLHTPIITSVDAEGAGEVFEVTGASEGNTADKGRLFFDRKVFLTVSGQLAAEAGIMGLGKVYTFGPTFRAENSHTRRHLAEFWMIEPEMAFYDLQDTIDLAEQLLKYVIHHVLTHHQNEMDFLEKRALKKTGTYPQKDPIPLRTQLHDLIGKHFTRITYTEAIAILSKATIAQPSRFVYPVTKWGIDLQTEHEHYLVQYFQGGVVITDYPKAIKAFYMRQNEDQKTVAAMDILLPRVGEVVGGAQREERLDRLQKAMQHNGIDLQAMDWYLDTRRFGTVPHSGFGMGLERLVLLITGMDHIQDVIPFPRTPGRAMG